MGTMPPWRFGRFGTLEMETGVLHVPASARRSQWMNDIRMLKEMTNMNVDVPPPVASIPDVEPDRERKWLWWLDGCRVC